MHFNIVVLLAVLSNLTEAGPVRQYGRFIKRNQAPRFSNESAIATTSDALQAVTPIAIPTTLLSSTTDAPTSSPGSALEGSTASTISNAASVTATQSNAASTSTASYAPSTPSFVAPPVVENGASLAQISGVTSSGVSISQPTTASTQASNTLDGSIASAAAPLASSTGAVVEIPVKNTYQFAAVTVASTSSDAPKPSSTVQYPNAQNGNTAMASGFNQIYKTLSETSSCDASDNNQAFSCISGELAQCQSDGTYVLKSCPQGQSCYALPLPSGQTGISVECAVPSEAANRLAGQQASSSITVSATFQAASTIASSAPQKGENLQGGLVVGGFNEGPMTTTVQQPAQTKTPSALTKAESNSHSASLGVQTSMTTPAARAADQGSSGSKTPQTIAPTTTVLRNADSDTLGQSSASQVFSVAPTTTASHLATAEPENQFSVSPTTLVTKPVDALTSQATLKASPSTTLSQLPDPKPEAQPPVTKTTPEASSTPTEVQGPIFSVLSSPTLSPSLASHEEHQPQHTETSSSTSPPQPTAIAQELPAAAKDETPQPPPTKTSQPAGITIIPLTPNAPNNKNNDNNNNPAGSNNPSGNNIVNEKVAVGSAVNSPIYITVTTTVTTTAYDAVPTA